MSIIGKGLKVLGAFFLTGSLLLGSSAASAAYFFSYQGFQNLEGNVSVAANPESFLITNYYDDGNELSWEIISVYEDDQGGVEVEYEEIGGGEYASFHGVSGSFQILRADGDTTPERVYVDAWGMIELIEERESAGGDDSFCCAHTYDFWVDSVLYSRETGGGTIFDPEFGQGPIDGYYSYSGTREIWTNTPYFVAYLVEFYLETFADLPTYFVSMDEYKAFVDANGMSGVISIRVSGFFEHGIALRPHEVPEPGTLLLLGLGLGMVVRWRRFGPKEA